MQTQQNPNAYVVLTARYGGTCLWCHSSVSVGDEIAYRHSDRKLYHAVCLRNKISDTAQPQPTVTKPVANMTQAHALSNLKGETYHAPDNSANGRAQAEAFHAMLSTYSADIPATGRKVDEVEAPVQAEPVTSTSSGIADGYYTVVLEDGTHRTFRIRTQSDDSTFAPGKQIIATLTGSDNESSYTQWGFVNGVQVAVWGKMQNRVGNWQALATGLLTGDHAAAGLAYAVESMNCYRCNRRLTDEVSIATGLGPVCRTK